jgi:hypothetical protein
MKKLVLLATLILMAGMTYGQNLQKGNLIGTHVISVALQPGATMEKYMDFYKGKVVPEYEKAFSGMKAYVVKSIRGVNKDSFGGFMVFKTEADRDKYFKADGSYTEIGNAAYAKLKPVLDELSKLGAMTSVYNDWLVL